MTIQAVLFDLDNTLTHRDLSVQAFSRHLFNVFSKQLNHSAQKDQILNIINMIRRIDNGGYPKKACLTHSSIAASVAYALIHQLDWDLAPSIETLTEFWFEEFGLCAVPMAGAAHILEQLKQRDFRLAVISNGGHATRLKILEGLGFSDYFDQVFSSESVGIAKPNPEIFLHSCNQIQCSPQQSLYIGDHPVNDYQGASQAGLKALLLKGFHPLTEARPVPSDNTIQDLHEIFLHLN